MTVKRSAALDVLGSDANLALDRREEAARISLELMGERARLATAEQELSRQQRVLEIPRRRDSSSRLFDAATSDYLSQEQGHQKFGQSVDDSLTSIKEVDGSRAGGTRPTPPRQFTSTTNPIEGLNLSDELLNPVYEVLDYQVALSRSRVSALDKRLEELQRTQSGREGAEGRFRELYQHEAQVRMLEAKRELARRLRDDLRLRFEQADVRITSRTAQLRIADPAVTPSRPVGPKRLRIVGVTAITTLCVLFAAVQLLILRAAATSSRRKLTV